MVGFKGLEGGDAHVHGQGGRHLKNVAAVLLQPSPAWLVFQVTLEEAGCGALGPLGGELTDSAAATEAGEHLPEDGQRERGGAGAELLQLHSPALLLDQHQVEDHCQELSQLKDQRGVYPLVPHPVQPGQHPGASHLLKLHQHQGPLH